jgi:flagellar basal-body rod protein FlgC
MGYSSAIAISAAGMEVQRARLDTAAVNIANVNTTRSVDGGTYVPLVAVTKNRKSFFDGFNQLSQLGAMPQTSVIQQTNNVPRLVFEPAHPDANEEGFVAYPGIDTVTEMVNLMTAVRSYEANVVALNAAKSMSMKAIDLGAGS